MNWMHGLLVLAASTDTDHTTWRSWHRKQYAARHTELTCIDIVRWRSRSTMMSRFCAVSTVATDDERMSELEFKVPFQHKHGYIRDEWRKNDAKVKLWDSETLWCVTECALILFVYLHWCNSYHFTANPLRLLTSIVISIAILRGIVIPKSIIRSAITVSSKTYIAILW